ncbi:MAG: cysteine--tRNA ligase [Acidiferrobacteraceae bacterium]|nr:cysteine--tRNA ligase [Acidiferrobacteraceae bacterium]|tara:strand:+ start:1685 stop:3163 length:1479 start_codon:yes stop_codon:yes gene_type:complete
MNKDNTIGGDFAVQVYNSLTGTKEALKTLLPGEVSIYVCGMTVYDYCHLGHARVLVVFDSVVRYLRSVGAKVHYVRNITDIDDKIINRANENGETCSALAERFIAAMHEDEKALNVLPPDMEPQATMFIDDIIALIERLEKAGYAYKSRSGDVLYRVRHFEGYGQLSGRSIDELLVGARVELNVDKEDPLDFVLWKKSKPGEPQWASPWGSGRPGWHIECSAMSMKCLGESFDIHAGGMDLKFPHHENEIAQSEASTGRKFVNYWMHNGYLQIDSEKMSKSEGNFYTIREILDSDANILRIGEVIRFMILSSHYRSPLNFSKQSIDNAKASLTRLYLVLSRSGDVAMRKESSCDSRYSVLFNTAMADDFNTPEAIAVLFSLVREINRLLDNNLVNDARELCSELKYLANVLGLLSQEPIMFLKGLSAETSNNETATVEWIERLIEERATARMAGDWAKADRIRGDLLEQGILLEDDGNGQTSWRLEEVYTGE